MRFVLGPTTRRLIISSRISCRTCIIGELWNFFQAPQAEAIPALLPSSAFPSPTLACAVSALLALVPPTPTAGWPGAVDLFAAAWSIISCHRTTEACRSLAEQKLKSMDSEVKVVESSFVAPSEPTPRKGLWVSPLDLVMATRGHTPTFYLFGSNDAASDFFDVARLKEAMAKALVAFYPLAGRLGIDSSGRMMIDCNGEGALFVVARSDITVDEIKNLKPSPELRRKLVPRIEPSSVVMAVQVTFFKCGGVALGTALHHVSIDASSAFHFFQTWSAFSRDGDRAAVELPCHDRSLLRARSPPTVHPDALLTFCPKLAFSDPSGLIAGEVFTISGDQVASLKRLCGGVSTFCAVSALMWQCTCIARRLPLDSEARLTFPANIRRRVKPPLPERYFGNAFITLGVVGAVRDIASKTLASVAGRIRDAISRMDDELVRSAIDYYEMAETMGIQSAKGTLPETGLQIISWLGTPMYDADFGWGKPRVMSRAESIRGGFVYLMRDGPAVGGVRVLMCMEAANMKELERLLYTKL